MNHFSNEAETPECPEDTEDTIIIIQTDPRKIYRTMTVLPVFRGLFLLIKIPAVLNME